jgi:hypothetical protein
MRIAKVKLLPNCIESGGCAVDVTGKHHIVGVLKRCLLPRTESVRLCAMGSVRLSLTSLRVIIYAEFILGCHHNGGFKTLPGHSI